MFGQKRPPRLTLFASGECLLLFSQGVLFYNCCFVWLLVVFWQAYYCWCCYHPCFLRRTLLCFKLCLFSQCSSCLLLLYIVVVVTVGGGGGGGGGRVCIAIVVLALP
jgi:hypothetical protein